MDKSLADVAKMMRRLFTTAGFCLLMVVLVVTIPASNAQKKGGGGLAAGLIPPFNVANCTLLFANWPNSSITVRIPNAEAKDGREIYTGRFDKPPEISDASCKEIKTIQKTINTLDKMSLVWKGVRVTRKVDNREVSKTLSTVTLTMRNKLDTVGGYWIISGANVTLQGDISAGPIRLDSSSLTATYIVGSRSSKFSFSCGSLDLQNKNRTLATQVSLQFLRFQIQPFPSSSKAADGLRFEDSFDCTVWMSEPLWMGLITTLLFTTIVSVGVYLLFTIKTMDRFENPKGKPLNVPTTE